MESASCRGTTLRKKTREMLDFPPFFQVGGDLRILYNLPRKAKQTTPALAEAIPHRSLGDMLFFLIKDH
jgi:hypothetical protein